MVGMWAGRGFFPHVFIYFKCQKNTLSEHIVCQAMLTLICFRKYKTSLIPQLGVTAIPGLSKLLKNVFFSVLFNVLWHLYFFLLYLRLR